MSAARELAKLIAADPEALSVLAVALRPLLVGQESKGTGLDLKAAAAYLGLSKDALDRRARRGEIPSVQEGPRCKRFFSTDALDAWISGNLQRFTAG